MLFHELTYTGEATPPGGTLLVERNSPQSCGVCFTYVRMIFTRGVTLIRWDLLQGPNVNNTIMRPASFNVFDWPEHTDRFLSTLDATASEIEREFKHPMTILDWSRIRVESAGTAWQAKLYLLRSECPT